MSVKSDHRRGVEECPRSYLGSDYPRSQQQWVSSSILVDSNMTEDRKSWSRCTIGTNRQGVSKRKSRLFNSCHIPMSNGCESAFFRTTASLIKVYERAVGQKKARIFWRAQVTRMMEESEGEESGHSSEEEEEEEESDGGAPPPPSRSPSPELSSDSDSSLSTPPLDVPEKTPLPRTEHPESIRAAERLLSRTLASACAEDDGQGLAAEMGTLRPYHDHHRFSLTSLPAPTQIHVLLRAPRRFDHPSWVPRQNLCASLDNYLADPLVESGQTSARCDTTTKSKKRTKASKDTGRVDQMPRKLHTDRGFRCETIGVRKSAA